MLKLLIGSVTVALLFAPNILAAVPAWGQCGGINHTGDTNCESGLSCVFLNDWFSQCTLGGNLATTSSSVNTPVPTESSPPPSNSGPGFVKTSGTSFTLDGANYAVVGSNSYWVGLEGYSIADMNQAFADIAGTGATVVRTWGFNEVTSPNGIFYQSWSGSTPTINTGATGLQNFDKVVSLAKSNGLKLIVALTNNWQDYGGMDVYVKQILNSDQHDLFYTDATVKNAYKDYVKAFVGRYVNEPGIMAWELVNEPRCTGTTGASTGTCTTSTITEWIKEMSAFVKSLDSNHLVAVGDEGFYNDPGNAAYPYQGGEGVDFDVNLAIPTIDFGTFHSYPTHWGQAANAQAFGTQWITDHAKSQQNANKPVILEEFGVEDDQRTVYQAWLNEVVNSGLAGDLIWQAGSHLSQGDTHDDEYAVYPDGDVYALLKTTSAELKSARS